MGCDSQTVPKNFKSQLFLTQEKLEVGLDILHSTFLIGRHHICMNHLRHQNDVICDC